MTIGANMQSEGLIRPCVGAQGSSAFPNLCQSLDYMLASVCFSATLAKFRGQKKLHRVLSNPGSWEIRDSAYCQ